METSENRLRLLNNFLMKKPDLQKVPVFFMSGCDSGMRQTSSGKRKKVGTNYSFPLEVCEGGGCMT